MTEDDLRKSLIMLDEYLLNERNEVGLSKLGKLSADDLEGMDESSLWDVFRALVNVREPRKASPRFYEVQDEVLRYIINKDYVSTLDDTTPVPGNERLRLWRGDITRLKVDAIVNAANSALLGCWVPGHFCIDNAIHTFAGVQLREECYRIMQAQGHEEPTGCAKVTEAFNLPSRFVIHTVGPIANGRPTEGHRRDLARSYTSCLDAAEGCGARTLAFCSISTGVFGFPMDQAVPIAIDAVTAWLEAHPNSDMTVIFNVFSQSDEDAYREALGI